VKLIADALIEACSDERADAGIAITSSLQPLGGADAPVKPAIYAGGAYQEDRRWRGEGGSRRVVPAIVIDSVPSQANRIEAALEAVRERLGLPELALDLSGLPTLPVHLPRRLSSFRLPHRNSDAYLRDTQLDGVPFLKSEVGAALFSAIRPSFIQCRRAVTPATATPVAGAELRPSLSEHRVCRQRLPRLKGTWVSG
jgi:CRISPR-associated protein Csb1